jgi:hypothetical protein
MPDAAYVFESNKFSRTCDVSALFALSCFFKLSMVMLPLPLADAAKDIMIAKKSKHLLPM